MNVNWLQARCAEVPDPDIFYPAGYTASHKWQVADAKAICNNCPIKAQCLEDALEAEGAAEIPRRFGIHGGMTPAERHKVYRRRYLADLEAYVEQSA
ncbi:WhiB family transcriptional regulator [Kitasatospora sp. NBC_00240]|uniref:WhiB family transcriptional regulator n=1 Tax=Kitasatospora sp. NBC_00240 TaxID=2903567 RepID=UPI0022513BB8|nr:WhiB family transcriptional regulator [Kitasatospora sp. NBC_00240]MCX5209715.1 WhiB family transcriptional regulator [Kitasatospora sp. NBC_00240]